MSSESSAVPTWDGHPKGWRRYCREVVWYVQATKVGQRRHLATRLIARLSGSARLLAMSWPQSELDNDRGVLIFLRKLAASPLVRRSLPNAAATMSQYFGFRKRQNETISEFLVRETLSYEEFQEALIRLREERSGTDPSLQDFGLEAIFRRQEEEDAQWNRWRNWRDSHDAGAEPAAEASADADATETGERPDAATDGYQRVPLVSEPDLSPQSNVAPEHGMNSADSFVLDVLRGWRLLQAATLSRDEFRDVLSATNNKLDFDSISGALQVLWDDQLIQHPRHAPSQFNAHWLEELEDPQIKEAYQSERMAEALASEASLTWKKAQEATAALRRDRDRGAPKGKSKGFNKGKMGMAVYGDPYMEQFPMVKGKGKGKAKYSNYMDHEMFWAGKSKGKSSKGSSSFSFRPPGPSGVNAYGMELYPIEFMETPEYHEPLDVTLTATTWSPPPSASQAIKSFEGMVDSGATASAGPEASIHRVFECLRQVDPEATLTVDQTLKPRFRYGSGKWGQALCQVTISSWASGHQRKFSVFALPNPPEYHEPWYDDSLLVPILIGMDFLGVNGVGLVLDFVDGYSWMSNMPGVASFNSVFIDVLPAQNRRNPRLVIEIFGVMPPKTNLADKAPELDHSRALPADPRDPRCGECWPCFGSHNASVRGSNRYGQWTHCAVCNLRTQYVPRMGSLTHNVEHIDPHYVAKALSMVQKDLKGVKPHYKLMKVAVEKIESDERYYQMVLGAPEMTPVPKSPTRHQMFTPPRRSMHNSEEEQIPGPQQLTSSPSWQHVTPPKARAKSPTVSQMSVASVPVVTPQDLLSQLSAEVGKAAVKVLQLMMLGLFTNFHDLVVDGMNRFSLIYKTPCGDLIIESPDTARSSYYPWKMVVAIAKTWKSQLVPERWQSILFLTVDSNVPNSTFEQQLWEMNPAEMADDIAEVPPDEGYSPTSLAPEDAPAIPADLADDDGQMVLPPAQDERSGGDLRPQSMQSSKASNPSQMASSRWQQDGHGRWSKHEADGKIIPSTEQLAEWNVKLQKFHKASGHPSNRNLARILREAGKEKWQIEAALRLRCPACEATRPGGSSSGKIPPVSTNRLPQAWHMVMMDVGEWNVVSVRKKLKFLLMIDAATKFRSTVPLMVYDINQQGNENAKMVIEAFGRGWLAEKPKPLVVVPDNANTLCSAAFREFCHTNNLWLSPPVEKEAWAHGIAERAVQETKLLADKIFISDGTLSLELCLALSTAALNSTENAHGFSPFQWAYGHSFQWTDEDITTHLQLQQAHPLSEFEKLLSCRRKAENLARQALKGAAMRLPALPPVNEYEETDFLPEVPDDTFEDDLGNSLNDPGVKRKTDLLESEVSSREASSKRSSLASSSMRPMRPHSAVDSDDIVTGDSVKKPRTDDDNALTLDLHAALQEAEFGYIMEMELDFSSHRKLKKFLQAPNFYLVQQMRDCEVRYERLTDDFKKLFDRAKDKEVASFLKSEAVRKCISKEEEEEGKNSGRVMKCRWVLTWKDTPPDERQASQQDAHENAGTLFTPSGDRKAKARIVLLGYQHPDLLNPEFRSSAPVQSTLTRHLTFQLSVQNQWPIEGMDLSTAFLQTEKNQEQNRIWTSGVRELRAALGVSEGGIMRILKDFYGSTTAPRGLWLDIDRRLRRLGAHKVLGDPCAWIWVEENPHAVNQLDRFRTIGYMAGHVDDFNRSGDETNPKWQKIKAAIDREYQWGSSKVGAYRYVGSDIHHRTGSQGNYIMVDQDSYVENLADVEIDPVRFKNAATVLTKSEIGKCRSALGALQWLAVQTQPQICARCNLLLSELAREPKMTVAQEIQQVIRETRKHPHRLRFDRIPSVNHWQQMVVVTMGDQAHNNRPDGSSTGGLINFLGGPELLDGSPGRLVMVSWRTWKLRRVAISSNDAEIQAMVEAEDVNFRTRLLWAELNGAGAEKGLDLLAFAEQEVSAVPGVVATDSKGGFDAVTLQEGPYLGLSNVRSAIQAFQLKQSFADTKAWLIWLASDWLLADALTKKIQECRKSLLQFMRTGVWMLQYNPGFETSARKNKRAGKDALTQMKKATEKFAS
ncbi:unnamed protein product [Cladocopium goreaui]|uniref:Retrovirus-related Pol polyprotein from transposon RE2 (Retro element 2) (AtRE2) n=1 Tax=Cladocopium goreaui TaxID=2562237 RepID=A0A9P1BVB0_9DINO|nr:unnamed protein product [Cladocopium goreaui]